MKLVRVAAIAAAALVVAAFAGILGPSGARGQTATEATSGGVTVIGTGSATLAPDRATFSFGAASQAKTASAALAASSQAMARVVDALRRAGVSKSDIQTSDVSLSPRTNESGDLIVGYTASNTVTATVRKLVEAGAVIDAAVAAGANQMYGPNLVAADQDAAYRSALKAALAEARAKAETLAGSSGLTLGRITAIDENGTPSPVPLSAGDTAKGSAVSIELGTQHIEATVSVTFALG
jgi:uncharacterized protein YggE